MNDERKFKYPTRFIVIGLMDYGLHAWSFETSDEVVNHLWGEYLPNFAVFKDRELIHIESGDLSQLKKQLEEDDDNPSTTE